MIVKSFSISLNVDLKLIFIRKCYYSKLSIMPYLFLFARLLILSKYVSFNKKINLGNLEFNFKTPLIIINDVC